MNRLPIQVVWTLSALALACAGQPSATPSTGSRARAGDVCSSMATADVGSATSERLARASNVLDYQNVWMNAHPSGSLGTLSGADLRSFIRTKNGEIRDCYESALDELADGRGRVVTRFVIGSDGRVRHVSLATSELEAPTVGCCLVQRIAQWAFPGAMHGDFVVVEYPFVVTVSHVNRVTADTRP